LRRRRRRRRRRKGFIFDSPILHVHWTNIPTIRFPDAFRGGTVVTVTSRNR